MLSESLATIIAFLIFGAVISAFVLGFLHERKRKALISKLSLELGLSFQPKAETLNDLPLSAIPYLKTNSEHASYFELLHGKVAGMDAYFFGQRISKPGRSSSSTTSVALYKVDRGNLPCFGLTNRVPDGLLRRGLEKMNPGQTMIDIGDFTIKVQDPSLQRAVEPLLQFSLPPTNLGFLSLEAEGAWLVFRTSKAVPADMRAWIEHTSNIASEISRRAI